MIYWGADGCFTLGMVYSIYEVIEAIMSIYICQK